MGDEILSSEELDALLTSVEEVSKASSSSEERISQA